MLDRAQAPGELPIRAASTNTQIQATFFCGCGTSFTTEPWTVSPLQRRGLIPKVACPVSHKSLTSHTLVNNMLRNYLPPVAIPLLGGSLFSSLFHLHTGDRGGGPPSCQGHSPAGQPDPEDVKTYSASLPWLHPHPYRVLDPYEYVYP